MLEYRKDKHALVQKALSEPLYLQTLSGIKDDLAISDIDDPQIYCIDDMDTDTAAETTATEDTMDAKEHSSK